MTKQQGVSRALFSVLTALFLVSGPTQANFDATIPVIDMNDYFSKTRHHIFIEGLTNAMRTVGFVAVINSSVNPKTLDTAYAEAKNFYALPLETKMLCNNPDLNGQRGYVQSEIAKGQKRKDFKEFYHITREYPAEVKQKYGYKSNIWPTHSRFKPAIQKLIVEMDEYIEIIEHALAESIGEKNDFFSKMSSNGDYLLRSIHYPANPPADTVWAAAHTDIDLFTVLPRATADGLQVMNSDGQWIDVVVPDNAFIINAGDMLQNITNGVYRSSMHRVISKGENQERYSMVAFIHARPTDRMDPLAKFVKEVGVKRFANATQAELLNERLIDLGLNNRQLLESFAASGAIDRLIEVNRASPTALRALRDADLASPKVLQALEQLELQA